MSSSTVAEAYKKLKLENEELKAILLKLTSKYKSSEIKRNVLMKRNVLLITDNKNLHLLLLESEKKRIVIEKTLSHFQEAFKQLKTEFNALKKEKICGGDQPEVKPLNDKPIPSSELLDGRSLLEDESVPYFEVSDDSATNLARDALLTMKHNPLENLKRPLSGDETSECTSQISQPMPKMGREFVQAQEINAYFQMADKTSIGNEASNKKTEAPKSNVIIKQINEYDIFDEKQRRLWNRILELRSMFQLKEKELEKRRFAVAVKTEMVQNAQKEIKKIQELIALTKE